MVIEKENGSRDNMINMGLPANKIILSNFIYYGVLYLVYSILICAFLKRGFFNYINYGVVFIVILIYYYWIIL